MHKRNSNNIERRLQGIIKELLNLKSTISLGLKDCLRSSYHMDSLDLVEIVMDIEDEFKIQIEDEEAVEWKTYGDVIKSVEHHVKLVFAIVTKS